MSECDAILRNGIFNTIIVNTSQSVREQYTTWLKTATFNEMKSKTDAGLKIGFPIQGIPFELKGTLTQDDYNNWQQHINSGTIRDLTIEEEKLIVHSSVDQGIVDAWLECHGLKAFGLLDYETIGDDGNFSILFRYAPNVVGDLPPIISELVTVNCNCRNPPPGGSEVTYGGFTCSFFRQTDTHGNFPRAEYALNTSKGSAHGEIPAIIVNRTPKLRGVQLFHAVGSRASWPSAQVSVPAGYKLIGGGARVNWQGAGSLLTSSFPISHDTWRADAKDHSIVSPATIDVWAIGIHDPDDDFEVVIDNADSVPRNHPEQTVSARSGFQLVGGGARANWNPA